MNDPDEGWTFQAIRVAYKDEPLRVLEERLFPAREVFTHACVSVAFRV